MSTPSSTSAARWAGGVPAFGMIWQKFMMWWFIVTDALLFAGFLASYGFSRLGSTDWPDPTSVFPMVFVTAMTFVLISSSATMAAAVAAARARDPVRVQRYLLLTILGGVCFLGMQGFEWGSLIAKGAGLTHNPWGAAQFTSYFFMITAFHGTHVLLGVVILAIVLFRAMAGCFSGDGVEVAGLYWHFVDLVWVFIFGCFYLL